MQQHEDERGAMAPSEWITRHAGRLSPGATVLDLACGAGRHARWLAGRGLRVTAVDRDATALAALAAACDAEIIHADLEGGPWPLPGRRFDAIVVTRYLHRPLLPVMVDSLAEGGLLVYETFMDGQARFGRPSNPDFLLRPGELLALATACGLDVIEFREGFADRPAPSMLQAICARRQRMG